VSLHGGGRTETTSRTPDVLSICLQGVDCVEGPFDRLPPIAGARSGTGAGCRDGRQAQGAGSPLHDRTAPPPVRRGSPSDTGNVALLSFRGTSRVPGVVSRSPPFPLDTTKRVPPRGRRGGKPALALRQAPAHRGSTLRDRAGCPGVVLGMTGNFAGTRGGNDRRFWRSHLRWVLSVLLTAAW
jgi:hypothetical protein